ncbi:MAG: ABC transporter permease [Bacillota bacterium]
MLEYIGKRMWQTLIVLFLVSIIVFIMVNANGDPVQSLLPPDAEPWAVEELRTSLGLDKPLYVQYFMFVKNALQGDMGISYYQQTPALNLVLDRLPKTVELALAAILLSIIIAIPAGAYAAVKPESPFSKFIMFGSLAGISLPTFLSGILLILVFAVSFSWLPSSGRGDVAQFLGMRSSLFTLDGWKHIIMPAATLGLYMVAMLIRLVRAGMMEVLKQDYISFAKAKGMPGRIIYIRHALKNTMIPVITVIGLQLGRLIGFSMITETIFAWPGMGKLILDSINRLDRPVIMSYILVVAVIFAFINLTVDLLYYFFDPRIELN